MSFLNKGKVKFLQIKQETIRQKCFRKHKKDSVSAYIHMRRETLCPCTQLHAFWMTPPPIPHQLRTYLIDGPSQPKKYIDIPISYSLKYKHSEKFIYKKINGSVG